MGSATQAWVDGRKRRAAMKRGSLKFHVFLVRDGLPQTAAEEEKPLGPRRLRIAK
jgi:hypothetical protein